MEQPKRWRASNESDEAPTFEPGTDAKLSAELAALCEEGQALENEVNCGEAITAMGRD